METVIRIVLIIVLCCLLYSLYFKLQIKLRRRRQEKKTRKYFEKKRKEYAKKLKREEKLRDEKSNNMLPRFENSQCVKECAERIKQTIPQTPYDWSVEITLFGLEGCFSLGNMSFYELGYKNLESGYEVVAFAKALAFHLGPGFEYYYTASDDNEYDSNKCLVRYKSKPLRDI